MRLASPDLVLCCASRLSHSRVVVVRAQLAEDAPSLCKAWFHFIYWWRRHHDTMANFHRVRDLDCTSLGQNLSSTFRILCIYVVTGLGFLIEACGPTGPSDFDGTTSRKVLYFRRHQELRLTCSRIITLNSNMRNAYDWFINTWRALGCQIRQ